MHVPKNPIAVVAAEAPPRTKPSNDPEPFASRMAGREKRALGEDVSYLEVGDRTPGDEGVYPDDDLKAALVDGKWQFTHKDGTVYRS